MDSQKENNQQLRLESQKKSKRLADTIVLSGIMSDECHLHPQSCPAVCQVKSPGIKAVIL